MATVISDLEREDIVKVLRLRAAETGVALTSEQVLAVIRALNWMRTQLQKK